MKNKQDHSRVVEKILVGARWTTGLRFAAQLFSWLSTIIVVRFVSPEDYGLNSMLTSPLVLMMLVSTLGLEAALVQVKTLDGEMLRSIFGALLALNGLLFLSFFIGSPVIAEYFNEPRLGPLAKALSFIFLLVPFRVIPNALLDRNLDFKLRASLEIAATVASAIITVLLAYLGAGVWALVLGVIANRMLLAALLMIYQPWFVVPNFNLLATRQLISLGGLITLATMITVLSDQLITMVAGPQIGAAILGVFVVASDLASIPLSRGMPIINQIILPAFSKFQDDRENATYYYGRLLTVASIVFVPMLVGLACVADSLILALVGAKWEESIAPLALMSLGMIFRMHNHLNKTVMISMGHPTLLLTSNFLQLTSLFFFIFLALEHGAVGLILAWILTEFLIAIISIPLSQRFLNTNSKFFLHTYRAALVSSILMSICVMGTRTIMNGQTEILTLSLSIFVGIVSFYFAMRLLFLREMSIAVMAIFGSRFGFLVGVTPNHEK